MRGILTEILSSDPDIEVIGTAEDPHDARQKIKLLNPDVVTLDIEMPHMHGIDFLEKIMTLRPMPVVMISSLTTEGADESLRALELGAVDFIAKPMDWHVGIAEKREEIISKVKAAGGARLRPSSSRQVRREPRPSAYQCGGRVVAVGASTGGVEALGRLLSALPAGSPPILVAQHMPERFVPVFANRLDGNCEISVSEARDGQKLQPGHAYIAPGDRHLRLAKSGTSYVCRLGGNERVSGHCPSVDVLFHSVAEQAGAGAVGVILTGMGRDGASGLLAMRQAGAHTIGQDATSSLIYGMPRVAFESGAVEEQLPLGEIAARVLDLCAREHAKS
jgi:two-component system chemotaxis response regulator CheB